MGDNDNGEYNLDPVTGSGGSVNAPPPPPASPQGPGAFGTGMYAPPPFAVFQPGITGQPAQGYTSNYGLNDVWGQMQGEINRAASQGGQMAVAPVGRAAQGVAAQGTAAQGAAALGNASQWQAAQLAAAQAAPVQLSTAGDAAFQAQQQNLAAILGAQAAGGGVSPADIQLRQGRDANTAAQLAILGSQRGGYGNTALATRAAADQGAAADAQLNATMGLQRAQETLQAQQALGGVLGTARGQSQNYNLNAANLAAQNNEFNVGQTNQIGLADLAALNAQNEGNAQLSQQMGLANLSDAQAMALANLGYANQFGLANLGNDQAMALSNLGNAQQTGLANLNLAGQYGLANQQMSLANAQLYDNELNAMLGGMTGIGESNRAANLAGQQLGVQQQLGLGQIGEESFANAAQANANLANALLGFGIGAVGAGMQAFGAGGPSAPAAPGAGYTGGQDVGQSAPPPDTSGAGGSITGGAYDTGDSTDTNPTPPDVISSDERKKTEIRALESRRGDSRTSPYADVLRRVSGMCLSDKNLKEGIEGGNPMLDSFLREYHDATQKEGAVDVTGGLDFRGPTATKVTTAGGGGGGGGIFGKIGGAVGGAAGGAALGSVVPGIGTAIGGIVGGLLGSAAGSAADMPGGGGGASTTTIRNPGTGVDVPIEHGGSINEDDASGDDGEFNALSDDREKEAVMSGNRGLQAFLEQQGAQTGAQNGQGGYSNAFMQTGAAPSAQVDRQLPPWMGGYGYGLPGYGAWAGMGGVYGGGMMGGGGFQGGGLSQMGGVTQGASITNPGGVTQMGGPQASTPPIMAPPGPGAVPGSSGGGGGLGGGPFGAGGPPAWTPTTPPLGAGERPPPPHPAPPPAVPHAGFAGAGGPVAPPPRSIPLHGLGGLGSAGSFSALSDEDEKQVDDQDPKEVQAMLDHLHAYSYRYKDPTSAGAAPGRHVGVMAQDLEKSPLGAGAVHDTDAGKMVNFGHLQNAMLAGLAMLNERANDHEEMLRQLAGAR